MKMSSISQNAAHFRCAVCLTFSLLVSFTSLSARAVQDWTYKDLQAASDVIAVAEPISNENNSDKWEWTPEFAQGVTTTFKVICYFKGDDSATTLRLKHFVYKGGIWPPNGGLMVNFMTGSLKASGSYDVGGNTDNWAADNVHPTWLIFLKKGADETYVPTSGQIDPAFSFRELHGATMFNLNHGLTR